MADEPAGFTRGLDGGLFDGSDRCVQPFWSRCGDGDEAGHSEDAMAGGEVGLLLEDVAEFGGLLALHD